jgi:diacylglycerol kinase (ATP)
MHNKRLLDSFNFAIEGLIYVARTQRHMRYHLMMAAMALFFAIYSNPPFDIQEMIILLQKFQTREKRLEPNPHRYSYNN